MLRKHILSAAVAASSLVGGSAYAATFDLAFIMDESGSVGSGNYDNAMDSLADALEASLTADVFAQDSYNITVISFSDTNGGRTGGAATDVDVTPTLVTSVAELGAVTASIRAASYDGGNTNYAAAFDRLAALGAVTAGSDGSIINMMTDGEPCLTGGGGCPPAVGSANFLAIEAARDDLLTAGWDALSFEAVTSNPDSAYLAGLAFDTLGVGGASILTDPDDITDPLNAAFVLEVSSFGDDYDAAIASKVARIVDPSVVPIPASLPLLAGGLALFGFVGRRRRAAA